MKIWTTDDGTNIFRILFYSIPSIMSLIWKKYIDAGNNKQISHNRHYIQESQRKVMTVLCMSAGCVLTRYIKKKALTGGK